MNIFVLVLFFRLFVRFSALVYQPWWSCKYHFIHLFKCQQMVNGKTKTLQTSDNFFFFYMYIIYLIVDIMVASMYIDRF